MTLPDSASGDEQYPSLGVEAFGVVVRWIQRGQGNPVGKLVDGIAAAPATGMMFWSSRQPLRWKVVGLDAPLRNSPLPHQAGAGDDWLPQ